MARMDTAADTGADSERRRWASIPFFGNSITSATPHRLSPTFLI
jgi:hypothetical protein